MFGLSKLKEDNTNLKLQVSKLENRMERLERLIKTLIEDDDFLKEVIMRQRDSIKEIENKLNESMKLELKKSQSKKLQLQ